VNAARELSKCMDEASHTAYNEMISTMRFVLDTEKYCFEMQIIDKRKNGFLFQTVTVIGLVILRQGFV
jgi:hypothetical protein